VAKTGREQAALDRVQQLSKYVYIMVTLPRLLLWSIVIQAGNTLSYHCDAAVLYQPFSSDQSRTTTVSFKIDVGEATSLYSLVNRKKVKH
jgi:hypothetical protein